MPMDCVSCNAVLSATLIPSRFLPVLYVSYKVSGHKILSNVFCLKPCDKISLFFFLNVYVFSPF